VFTLLNKSKIKVTAFLKWFLFNRVHLWLILVLVFGEHRPAPPLAGELIFALRPPCPAKGGVWFFIIYLTLPVVGFLFTTKTPRLDFRLQSKEKG